MQGFVSLGQAYSACAVTLVPAFIVKERSVGVGAKSAVTVSVELIVNEHVKLVVPAHGPEIQPRNVDPFAVVGLGVIIEVGSGDGVAVNMTSVPGVYVPVQLPACSVPFASVQVICWPSETVPIPVPSSVTVSDTEFVNVQLKMSVISSEPPVAAVNPTQAELLGRLSKGSG